MARTRPPVTPEQERLIERTRSVVDTIYVLTKTRNELIRDLRASGMSQRHIEAAVGDDPTRPGTPRITAKQVRTIEATEDDQ